MNSLRLFDYRSLAIAASIFMPDHASAQEIVMRRPIPVSRNVTAAAWSVTPWLIYDGSKRIDLANACGDYTERREVTCLKADGTSADEYFCSSSPKPAAERPARHDEGCSYSWNTGGWNDPGDSCTLRESQTRSATCLRDSDRAVMPESMCSDAKPETTRQVPDFANCTYTWKPAGWSDPGASCTNAERQTREVACVRDLDGAVVDGGLCKPDDKPALTHDVRDISGCTYSWKAGTFIDPGTSCTRAETQTRDVACIRSLDGEVAQDAACTGPRPSATQQVADYAACSYKAVQWSGHTFDSTCSATAKRTRTAKCERSNDGGEIVADAECTGRDVPLTETSTVPNYSTCSTGWTTGEFVDPGASCGDETQIRDVTCRRDLDHALQPDASCAAGSRPLSTRIVNDVSACSYTAVNWTGWTPSSTCSASATRTRTAECRRSDGTTVAGSECTTRDVAVSKTVSDPNYTTCSSSWVAAAFVDPGASCTATETQTRGITCQRDLDHAVLADAACIAATRPAASQQVADYSSCGYTAVNWSGWTPSSTCSATATRTRAAQCRRSDGTMVAAAECTSRGIALTETVAEANYSSCSNSWATGAFVDPGASCTSAETQTRSVICQRDLDRAVQADAACSAATRPASSQQVVDYSSCAYTAANWSGWTPSSTCSATATKTRTAACRRSDGTMMPAAECTSRSIPLTETVAEANYSSCSNSWATGAFADPGASCTATETQTRPVWCKRDLDGAVQTDAACSAGSRPNATQQVADYSSCSYAYGGWSPWTWNSQCSATATRTQTRTCYRQDGTAVASSNCTSTR